MLDELVTISRLTDLPLADLRPLLAESRAQGFDFLDRLVSGYENGRNRFNHPDEALFGVYAGTQLIAIGGLNRDPYLPDGATGRVRHVYVLAAWRRLGVGRLLLDTIIAEARRHYRRLTLRTMTDEANRFYCALGFQTTPRLDGATHHLVFAE